MNSQFKKLFDINYNEKTFTIFVDEHHRCTFLEKTKEEKYIYPTLEDFLALNKIYNENDPFVLHDAKKYSFKEKVRMGAALVAISISLSRMDAYANENIESNWKISQEEDTVEVEQKAVVTPEMVLISDSNDLYTIFGISSVTLEDIDKVLESNTKLDTDMKKMAHDLAASIYENEPTADLRVYYLNLRDDLEIIPMNDEEYEETFKNYSGACYDVKENKIFYKLGCDEETFYHELSHTVYSFWREIDNKIYYKSNWPHALNEALNNKIVDYITPSTSYENIGMVLDYLLTFVEYDFHRYLEEGPSYIIHDLFEYSVDAYYISDCLTAMKNSSIELGEYIEVQNCSDLLDKLFLLCKSKVNNNMTNVYEPFLDFAKLFPNNEELFDKYLKEYNAYLEEMSIDNRIEEDLTNRLAIYQNVKGFVWDKETLYPYIDHTDHFTIIIENGKKKGIRSGLKEHYQAENFYFDLKKELLKQSNPNRKLNSNFWKEFAVENDYILASRLYKTEILFNNNRLTEEYLSDISIQIGLTEQEKIGFILTDSQKNIIYKTSENLKNISNTTNFSWYCNAMQEKVETIELSTVLNEMYLKSVEEKMSLFSNLLIEGNELRLEPFYFLYLEREKGGMTGVNLNRCMIYEGEEESISRFYLEMNFLSPLEEPIYLKEVLAYYELLDENKHDYKFTEVEIKKLIEGYLEERNNKIGR